MSMNRKRAIGGLAFCTIIRQGQLAQVRALADSIRAHHPGAPLYVLVLAPPSASRLGTESFVVVNLEELGLPNLPRLRFLCTVTELARIARPYLLAHLFAHRGTRQLVCVDPGLLLVDGLRTLERRLNQYPIVVAPHQAAPRDAEQTVPDDRPLVALAHGPQADAYLDGWLRKVNGEGSSEGDRERWNQVWVEPFPGVVRRDVATGPEAAYVGQRFDNGAAITELVRRCYRKLGATALALGDPFVTAGRSFFAYLTSFVGSDLPPLLREIYDERADLRALFPDVAGQDCEGFLTWADNSAAKDHDFDPALLAAVRSTSPRPWSALGGPVTEPFGVNVLGLLQSEKGMGEHCRSTVRALASGGVPYALNNWVDRGSSNVDTTHTHFTEQNPYPINLIHMNACDAPHVFRSIPRYFAGHYNIGYWNWELEWFPKEWHASFQYFDEIWTLSTFTRDSIARVSPIPVRTIPTAIVVPPVQPSSISRQRLRVRQHAFLFLFAFDFHSHLARKNPLAVIEAFRRAFPTRRDVALVLKTSRGQVMPLEFSEVLLACQGQPNIHIVREVLSRMEMYDLLRLCDAYVGLHRSEGFGLPLAEAMALGKPVIATGYSANVDFMNETNSYPVRYRMVAIEEDHGPYRKGAEWADPDVEHAAEQLRRVVEEPEAARAVAERARADMARFFSPQAVGQQMRDRLNAIVRRGVALGDPRFVLNTKRMAA